MMALRVETTYPASPEQVSELDLITAAQSGNRYAYGDLVSRHRAGVVSVVFRMSGSLDLAEEAAQEAFLRAWQRLDGYKPQHSFRSWVYRIAINAALDMLRQPSSRREQVFSDLENPAWEDLGWVETLPADEDGPETTVETRQRAERVRRAVLNLPAPSRSVLVLREYAGLSYTEIASSLGIPIGTVMSRLSSARSQLRQSLAAYLEVL
jgi:RNA polymerase sigma-70 factor (ECF subfamily)